MPRTSCIEHPKRSRYVVIWDHYLRMFEGDLCAAALLAAFEFLANGELDRQKEENTGPLPMTCDMDEIERSMLGVYGQRSMRDAIQCLCESGLIEATQKRIGDVKSYLFRYDLVQDAILQRRVFAGGKIADEKNGSNTGKIADDTCAILPMTSLLSNELINNNCTTVQENPEEKSGHDEEREDQQILKLNQSIWRRLSGDRKFNIHTRENEVLAKRTVALSRKCGEDPFTANMETYLKEASKPTYKNFLDSFGQYRKEYPQAETRTHRHAIAEPVVVAVDPPIQPASSNAQKPGPGLPELVLWWNERTKNLPKVEIWVRSGRTHEDLERNVANPEFMTNREALLERCDTLAVFSKTHKFGMVFDFAFCMKNWAGILNGQYNYLTSGETAKKKLAVDSVLAKLHKDIAARKAAERQHAS